MPAESVPDLDRVVAANVRAQRARLRMRQSDLADRLGWVRQAVAALEGERRRVGLVDLVALCDALEVPVDVLLEGADPRVLRALGIIDADSAVRIADLIERLPDVDDLVDTLAETGSTGIVARTLIARRAARQAASTG